MARTSGKDGQVGQTRAMEARERERERHVEEERGSSREGQTWEAIRDSEVRDERG